MLNQLHKENLKLQKAFCNLYCCFVDQNNNGVKARDVIQEKRKLAAVTSYFKKKVIQLQKELHSSKEKYELLEFCFLELEQQTQNFNAENFVERGVNTDLCWATLKNPQNRYTVIATKNLTWIEENWDILACHYCLEAKIMDQDHCRKKLDESRQKLSAICKQLDVINTTGTEKREWRCIHEIVSSVEELQSLIAWIIEKKGTKEDSSVISQKLQKLNRIRKVLEKSAYESQKHLWPLINQGKPFKEQDLQKLFKKTDTKGLGLSVKRKVVNFALPYDNISATTGTTEENFEFTDFNPEGSYPDDVIEVVDKNYDWMTDKNTKVYINESYAPFHSLVKPRVSRDVEDQPDSLCTAISEDEGLGEESRRGDITGPNSLLEVSDSVSDLPMDLTLPPEVFCDEHTEYNQNHHGWALDSRNHRNSLELCLEAIAKLKNALSNKESELVKLKSSRVTEEEIARLNSVIDTLQNENEMLKKEITVQEKQSKALREQILELEEAENDARFKGQHLQERLVFLQEKDSHFQAELTETKQSLELCIDELSIKDSEERELHSQIKYMEALVQKYEEQIKRLEKSESELKHTLKQMEELLPDEIKNQIGKNCDKEIVPKNNAISSDYLSEISDLHVQSIIPCEFSALMAPPEFRSSYCDKSVQTETINQSLCNATHLQDSCVSCGDSHTSCDGNVSDHDIVPSFNCPVQQELLKRLHHLSEEDADLQQQLHYVDQVNLTLWQKLHDIQFNISECRKENVSDNEERSTRESSVISSNLSIIPTSPVDNQTTNENQLLQNYCDLLNSEIRNENLKDKLAHLENINSSFLEHLDKREKLCVENNKRKDEWIQTENRLMEELESLKEERNSMMTRISQLNIEKVHLTAAVDALENELDAVKLKHQKEVEEVTDERDIMTSDLQKRIDDLLEREKEYMKQITKLQCPKKNREEKIEFENLKMSYVELQLELEKCRDGMDNMRQEFEKQIEYLQEKHNKDENRISEALESLREKDNECQRMITAAQLNEKTMKEALEQKESELANDREQFRIAMQEAKEQHTLVESELRKKLFQMEEGTAVATQALTEERLRLEKELQGNIDDLRSKEAAYKTRIRELESNVYQLHTELQRVTGNLRFRYDSEDDSMCITNFQRERILKELNELRVREGELKEKLDEMEKKEAAYKETLEHADRIMASVERGYKNKIEELELSERSLKQKVGYLEEVENDLRVALQKERRSSDGRTPEDLISELSEAEKRENILKEDVSKLEQQQRNATQKIKDLEKIREDLELQLSDREDLVILLEKVRKDQEMTKKELLKVKKSEGSFQLALEQTESLLKTREETIEIELQRHISEKRGLEETINQLRCQVRDFKQQFEKHSSEEELESDDRASHYAAVEKSDLSELFPSTFSKGFYDYRTKKNSQLNGVLAEFDNSVYDCDSYNKNSSFSRFVSSDSMTRNAKNMFSTNINSEKVILDHETSDACDKPENETNTSYKRNGVLPTYSDVELQDSSVILYDIGETTKSENTSENIPKFTTTVDLQTNCNGAIAFQNVEKSNVDNDYNKVRLHLEQCMLRAMDVMKMEMEQKETSNSSGSNTSQASEDLLHSPINFHVVQQVGSDTLLVGWEYLSAPTLVGFEVYVNGQLHETVLTPDRRKAVIGGLDLNQNLTLSIYAISSSGQVSEPQTIYLSSTTKISDTFFFQEEEDEDYFDDTSSGEVRSCSLVW